MANYASGTIALVANTSAPTAPTSSSVAVTGLTGATYYFQITAVTAGGETTGSIEGSQVCTSGNGLHLTIPAISGLVLGYNVYVSATTGTETLQTAVPFTGTSWTMTNVGTNGVIAGGVVTPTTNTSGVQNVTLFTAPAYTVVEITDILLTTNQSTAFPVTIRYGVTAYNVLGTALFDAYLVSTDETIFKPSVPMQVPAGATAVLQLPAGSATTVDYQINGIAGTTTF